MNIGEKVRSLRLQRGLTQEELADRCELSKGFISLLERDLTSPSIATLTDILDALGSDLTGFFAKPNEEKLVFGVDDTCVKELPDGLRGSIRWLVPSAQKNRMEPILVEMAAGGASEWDDPHEGEEFGYVLAGAVQIEIGSRVVRARKDESFSYNPAEAHRLVNPGKTTCRFLWVSTPPSF